MAYCQSFFADFYVTPAQEADSPVQFESSYLYSRLISISLLAYSTQAAGQAGERRLHVRGQDTSGSAAGRFCRLLTPAAPKRASHSTHGAIQARHSCRGSARNCRAAARDRPYKPGPDRNRSVKPKLSRDIYCFLETSCGRQVLWRWGVVPLAGFELATFALRMRCSTN